MRNLENSEKTVLKKIASTLDVSYRDLVEIYLHIKIINEVTDKDLKLLLDLKIPVYQCIFALTKDRLINKNGSSSNTITFFDLKTIMFGLLKPGGLLYQEIDVTPRYHFSLVESIEIKHLLRQAKDLDRNGRQDTLSHLRIKYRFFPSLITTSRSRFCEETFDQFVGTGKIKVG